VDSKGIIHGLNVHTRSGLSLQLSNPVGVSTDSLGNIWCQTSYNLRTIQSLAQNEEHGISIHYGKYFHQECPAELNCSIRQFWKLNSDGRLLSVYLPQLSVLVNGMTVGKDDRVWIASGNCIRVMDDDGEMLVACGTPTQPRPRKPFQEFEPALEAAITDAMSVRYHDDDCKVYFTRTSGVHCTEGYFSVDPPPPNT